MTDKVAMTDDLVGQKLPRDAEMIVTAFLPNLKHLEGRFDRIDLDIKDLSIGIKDSNNRLSALEKRFDNFEVQVDKRFDLLSGDLNGFKGDVYRRFDLVDKRFEQIDKRFEQVDKRFEQLTGDLKEFKGDVYRRFEQVDKRFEQVDKRFEQVDKRFEQVDKRFEQLTGDLKDFKGDVDRRFELMRSDFKELKSDNNKRFDQIAASIERLGDKLDSRDARQRSFTLRMFGIAISISFFGVLGVLARTFGIL
jgi:chromosome segregation ATPase